MNRYRYKISLRVRHPSMDPAEITCVLHLAPSREWRAGEPRTSPRDQPLGGVWPETYWIARVMEEEWPGKDLPTAIAELLDRLELNRSFLAKVRSEGGTGGLIWTAQLPKGTLPDAFVSVGLNGPMIQAHTWSCFALTIDPKTGTTLSCIFTK
jgi:Domain of unknown function (DUF4279)